jgi:hypothetical protein
MKTKALILAGAAVWALGGTPALGGPCSGEIESVAKLLSSKDAGSGPTSGASAGSQVSGKADEHPPTAAVNQELSGKAASADDARAQTQGQPTAADQAMGAPSSGRPDLTQASAALERARSFDQQGKEADCMSATQEARRLSSNP